MADSTLLLGVDVGTTGAKALIADDSGAILAEETSAYDVRTPHPLWAEQWPQVWLDGLAAAVRGVIELADIEPDRVAALTVSSLYGGSGIPVDRQLEPLHPCLIWLDRRARAQTQWVRDHVDLNRLLTITGNGVDSYYGFTKILWLKEQRPDVWERTRYLLPPNAWLIERLTGELAVDHSSAGNIGGVYDLGERTWSHESCGMLGIDVDRFPARLVASHEVVGELHRDGAELTGLPVGTPVCAGGIDAAVATLSAGVLAPGRHVAMMGTSMCWGFVHGAAPTEPGLVSMPYVLQPQELIYTFGGAATAGAVPKWFRDEFGTAERAVESWTADIGGPSAYAQLDARAAQLAPGSDGLLMLPYLMGERSPIWDPDARGTIVGLTLTHRREHLYRAGLEGVAFALRSNIEAGRAAGYPLDDVMHVVGGGARSALWLEILANVVGLPLVATEGGEAAYCDAMLAAVATGSADRDDLADWTTTAGRERHIEPDAQVAAFYDTLYPHYLGLYEDLRERFAAMAALPSHEPNPG
jgi:ribulokinase